MTNKNRKDTRGRNFTFVLYPDNNIHKQIIDLINSDYYKRMYRYTVTGLLHPTADDEHFKAHIHVAMHFRDVWTEPAVKRFLTYLSSANGQCYQLFTKDNRIVDRKLERAYEKVLDESGSPVMEMGKNGKMQPKLKKGKLQRRDKRDEWKTYQPVLRKDGSPVYAPINTTAEKVATFVPEQWYETVLKFQGYVDSDGESKPVTDQMIWRKVDCPAVSHVEKVSNTRSLLIYFMHKDTQSRKSGKPVFSHDDFLWDKEFAHQILIGLDGGSSYHSVLCRILDAMNNAHNINDLLAISMENADGEMTDFIISHSYLIVSMLKEFLVSKYRKAWMKAKVARDLPTDVLDTYDKVDISEKEEQTPYIEPWGSFLVPTGEYVYPDPCAVVPDGSMVVASAPAPQPMPAPAPQPVPVPAPQLVPAPAPQSVPAPAPEPAPQPAPEPAPQPAPQPAPTTWNAFAYPEFLSLPEDNSFWDKLVADLYGEVPLS
jgi:hypothetical protein